MKFIIASYFNGDINPRHAESINYLCSALEGMGCKHEYYYADDKQPIDKAKNEWIWNFLQTDSTHLFMIDPALSWDLRGMVRFLNVVSKDYPVVAGAIPNKMGGFGANLMSKDNTLLGKEGENYRILRSYLVMNGFMCISREVFETLNPEFPVYIIPSQFGNPEKEITEFYKLGNLKGTEEIEFQKKISDKFKIFIEPNITFSLVGRRSWKGNLNQHLLGGKCML